MPAAYRNITLALLALLAWLWLPPSLAAKSMVGVIIPNTTPNAVDSLGSFRETLKAEAPSADIEILLQRPFPDAVALGNATRKLVAAGADLIVTYGTSATVAALNENSKIPLVFSGVYDPDNAHFAGHQLTGCGYKIPLTSLLRHLRELKQIDTVSVVYSSNENDTVRQFNELVEVAKSQQVTLIPIDLRYGAELDKVQLSRGDAILFTNADVVNLRLPEMLAVAKANQQPTIGIFPDLTEAGVTISLYNCPIEQSQKTAKIVAQIIGGRQPREIKSETLRTTKLVFNLRGAKSLGVNIPFQMVAEASRVIK